MSFVVFKAEVVKVNMNVMVRVPATNPMTTRRCQVASDASDDEYSLLWEVEWRARRGGGSVGRVCESLRVFLVRETSHSPE